MLISISYILYPLSVTTVKYMFNYCFYYHIYEKVTNPNFAHFANTKPTLFLTSKQNMTSHAYTTRFRTLQLTNNIFFIPRKFKHFPSSFVRDIANKTQLFKHKRIQQISRQTRTIYQST